MKVCAPALGRTIRARTIEFLSRVNLGAGRIESEALEHALLLAGGQTQGVFAQGAKRFTPSLPSAPALSRVSMIEFQKPTETLAALDGAHIVRCHCGLNQVVAEALVRPFFVVVLDELGGRVAQVTLAQQDDFRQTFGLDGQDEPFREGVQIR